MIRGLATVTAALGALLALVLLTLVAGGVASQCAGGVSASAASAAASEAGVPAARGLRVLLEVTGEATTYGNDPAIGWVDHEDNNRPALDGATNDRPGIAVYNARTLGGWWIVHAPGGATAILQQTDLGPAPGTEAILDVNAVAARLVFGVQASDFPSHRGRWTAGYLGDQRPAGADQTASGGSLSGSESAAGSASACPAGALASGPTGQRIAQIARRYLGMDGRIQQFAGFRPPTFDDSWCSWFATNIWRLAGVSISVMPYSGDPYQWGVEHRLLFKADGQAPQGATPPVGSALIYGAGPASSDHINLVSRVYADGSFDVIGGNQGPGIVSEHRACRLSTDRHVTHSSCDPRPVFGIVAPPESTS